MKKYLTLFTAMLCLFLALGLNTKAATNGDFEYTVKNGTVTITKYIGSATKVTIPAQIAGKKVTEIGGYREGGYTYGAFFGCYNLKGVTIPDSVTVIGDSAFMQCSLTTLTIPGKVKTIGEKAFSGCAFTSLTIPKGVTSIGKRAFWGCYNLKSVSIPGSLKTISEEAFIWCSKLTSVSIADGVVTIGDAAFSNTGLKTVTIPKTVTTFGVDCLGFNCESVGEDLPVRVSGFTIKGYSGSGAEQYAKDYDIKFISLGSAVAKKKNAAKNVKVGSVQTVGGNRYVVTSAKTVRYKKPVSKKITRIKVPRSVKINGKTYKVISINDKAFVGCSKLKTAIIPGTVKQIGKCAFYRCTKLKTIRLFTSKLLKSNVLKGAFQDIHKKATFYVPKGKKAAYRKIFLKRGATKRMKFKAN